MIGKTTKNESVILTLIERKTRFIIIQKLKEKSSECVNRVLKKIFKQYGKKWFNGSEVSRLTELESYLIAVYFAHAYASYERWTNENHNGLIREFLPKGKSFNLVSIQMITTIQNALNNKPRRLLDYYTPHFMFNRLCTTT